MREQHACIQRCAIGQRGQLLREPCRAELLQQAAHKGAWRVARGGARESALLAVEPHAAGRLAFEVPPGRAPHAPCQQDLRVRVAQQGHERAVASERQRLLRRQRLADGGRRRLAERQRRELRGRVEIERRSH